MTSAWDSAGTHAAEDVHGKDAPTLGCDFPDLFVQIVHCGTYGLAPNADTIVGLPRPRGRRDDADLVQTSVDPVDQVWPVPGEHEVRIPGPKVLLGRPRDNPDQLVLLYMRHSHAHRVQARRQFPLMVAFQLFFNDPDCGFSLDHPRSIAYGPARRPAGFSVAGATGGAAFPNTTPTQRALRQYR